MLLKKRSTIKTDVRIIKMQLEHSPERARIRDWFNISYSRKFLKHSLSSSFDSRTMSCISPQRSPSKIRETSMTPRREMERNYSSSPRYLSPIANYLDLSFSEVYQTGCSACGTKAIDDICTTYNESPPRLRASHRRSVSEITDNNSGAYAKIMKKTRRLRMEGEEAKVGERVLEEKVIETSTLPHLYDDADADFEYVDEVGSVAGSEIQTTLLKEVVPPPLVGLTPLNYDESMLLKEAFYTNSLAEKAVKEEERRRVAVRRAEYSNRDKGIARVVELTTHLSAADKSRSEAAMKTLSAFTDTEVAEYSSSPDGKLDSIEAHHRRQTLATLRPSLLRDLSSSAVAKLSDSDEGSPRSGSDTHEHHHHDLREETKSTGLRRSTTSSRSKSGAYLTTFGHKAGEAVPNKRGSIQPSTEEPHALKKSQTTTEVVGSRRSSQPIAYSTFGKKSLESSPGARRGTHQAVTGEHRRTSTQIESALGKRSSGLTGLERSPVSRRSSQGVSQEHVGTISMQAQRLNQKHEQAAQRRASLAAEAASRRMSHAADDLSKAAIHGDQRRASQAGRETGSFGAPQSGKEKGVSNASHANRETGSLGGTQAFRETGAFGSSQARRETDSFGATKGTRQTGSRGAQQEVKTTSQTSGHELRGKSDADFEAGSEMSSQPSPAKPLSHDADEAGAFSAGLSGDFEVSGQVADRSLTSKLSRPQGDHLHEHDHIQEESQSAHSSDSYDEEEKAQTSNPSRGAYKASTNSSEQRDNTKVRRNTAKEDLLTPYRERIQKDDEKSKRTPVETKPQRIAHINSESPQLVKTNKPSVTSQDAFKRRNTLQPSITAKSADIMRSSTVKESKGIEAGEAEETHGFEETKKAISKRRGTTTVTSFFKKSSSLKEPQRKADTQLASVEASDDSASAPYSPEQRQSSQSRLSRGSVNTDLNRSRESLSSRSPDDRLLKRSPSISSTGSDHRRQSSAEYGTTTTNSRQRHSVAVTNSAFANTAQGMKLLAEQASRSGASQSPVNSRDASVELRTPPRSITRTNRNGADLQQVESDEKTPHMYNKTATASSRSTVTGMKASAKQPKKSANLKKSVIEETSAVLIQRHFRDYYMRNGLDANKAMQTEEASIARLEKMLYMLVDDRVIKGLRLIGGFVQYLEERGLDSMKL